MNISTSDPALDMPKTFALQILSAMKEGEKNGYRMMWKFVLDFISQHTLYLIIILTSVFLIAYADYRITRRWRSLGSVLYNYFYFGLLFIITLMFGPEIFTNDFIKIGTFGLYVICFILVGKVLKKTGIRKGYRAALNRYRK